jgi:hypothetical protein
MLYDIHYTFDAVVAGPTITRGDTISSGSRSTSGTDASVTHTVDTGTTLLVVTTMYEAGETVSGTPSWSLGGGENLTLVDETTRSGSNNDMCISTYALASPTAGAGTVTVTHSSNDNYITTAVNYIGTKVSATMTDNIAFISEDVNDAATNTSVFASGGTTGNTLYAAGSFKGGDGDGITVPTNFFEIFDGASGANAASDISGYVCDNLNGAADSCTWTWAATDENAGHYLEIIPAPSESITLRNLSSTIDVADSDVQNIDLLKLSVADLLDNRNTLLSKLKVNTTEIGSEVLIKFLLRLKSFTQSIELNDYTTKERLQFFGDSLNATEAVYKDVFKTLADSITAQDALASAVITEIIRLLADNISLQDAIIKAANKALHDDLDLADALAKELISEGQIYLRNLSSALDMDDATVKELAALKAAALDMNDATNKQVSTFLFNAIDSQDAARKEFELLKASSLNIEDVTIKELEIIKATALEDIQDFITRQVGLFYRNNIDVQDALSALIVQEIVRYLSSNVSVDEALTLAIAKSYKLPLDVSVSALTKNVDKLIEQELNVTDLLTSAIVSVIERLLTDALSVNTSQTAIRLLTRSYLDSLNVVLEAVNVINRTSLLQDVIDFTDVDVLEKLLLKTLRDAPTIADDVNINRIIGSDATLLKILAKLVSLDVKAQAIEGLKIKSEINGNPLNIITEVKTYE